MHNLRIPGIILLVPNARRMKHPEVQLERQWVPFNCKRRQINFVNYFTQTRKGKGTALISAARKIR